MVKTPSVVERIRARRIATSRKNVTFRLPLELIEKFRATCQRLEVEGTEVVETLVADFLEKHAVDVGVAAGGPEKKKSQR